ncbi:hypothetical protein E4U43_004265 [Claviceps pusilla]|uniref:Succinate dehydrogenase assembly factor 4, mitochondrial n=1 Tax=Claviceps pusilla TaxID=123648 RepID=A0A9P7N4F8_9HYPO|nr:hypothetical protein E4U43_004265 [Claviceps pusilla]
MNRLLFRHSSSLRALRSPSTRRPYSFTPGPSPLKLPAAQQAEFERLQRKASLSSAFQPAAAADKDATTSNASAPQQDQDDALPAGVFRGAKPEFSGDTNPRTGEVGGPKNEPLRWGGEGDWSYNGRVTDF